MTSLTSTLNPEALETLFAKDPFELSRDDLAQIVSAMRAHRDLWAKEEAAAKAKGRRPSHRAPITLGDLGL